MKPNLKPEIEALIEKYKAEIELTRRVGQELRTGQERITGEIATLLKILS